MQRDAARSVRQGAQAAPAPTQTLERQPLGLISEPVTQPSRIRAPALSAVASPRWLLAGILLIQLGLSLRLVWSNTAFGDEALYLWAGHLEWSHWLHGTPVPAFSKYFSGAPVIYPPLGALADSYGGLAAARLLSLALMLVSTSLLYLTAARLLQEKRSAFYAAACFAILGPTESLAFATYDAMALMLLALAAWLAVRAATAAMPELFVIGSGLVMALANATKYASALWDPVVIALAVAAYWHTGRWRRCLRAGRIALYTGLALAVALFRFGGPSYVHGLLITTLARASGTTPFLTVIDSAFIAIGPVAILSIIAVFASFRFSPRLRFLCITCAVACLLAPVNQARIHTLTSLHKHADFGAWFAAIGAGYAVSAASKLQRERSWRIAVAAGLFVPLALLAFTVSGDEYRWAPATQLLAHLRPLMRNSSARYLMDPESANLVYYYLHSQVYPGQINFVQCAWWDPVVGHELYGRAGCTAAIRAGYYQIVVTDDAADGPAGTPGEDAVWRAIRTSHSYRLAYRAAEPYHPHDLFQVWELKGAS
jgi:4-amino-4-deoxy-L-arabinose transferase-like glycosyltransferase